MNFFTHQDQARQRSSRLVLLFSLAVFGVVAAVYGLVVAVLHFTTDRNPKFAGEFGRLAFRPDVAIITIGSTLSVILLGVLYKRWMLSGGGAAVAESLGGVRLDPGSVNLDEKIALNVVEEMALAAGMPVPPVYILEEAGINAFAAGRTPQDAVIGLTRGAIQQLTRDELQGVVAHEFSHIAHGDVRLDIRLIGLLHGILLLALIGEMLLRAFSRSGSTSSRSDKKGAPIHLLALGVILFVVGWIGVFFGRLIKAAVSRQREFLADASAVQYTRNPAGIAGALKRIAAHPSGSRVEEPHAEETAHLFFCNALRAGFIQSLASHPPLEVRIRRLDPAFNGDFTPAPPPDRPQELARAKLSSREKLQRLGPILAPVLVEAASTPGAAAAAPATTGHDEHDSVSGLVPAAVVERTGTTGPEEQDHAHEIALAFPVELDEAVRTPVGAAAVILGLTLSENSDHRAKQLQLTRDSNLHGLAGETLRLLPALFRLDADMRLPLVERALPVLREISDAQFRALEQLLARVIRVDDHVSLFEYSIYRLTIANQQQVRAKTPPAAPTQSLAASLPWVGRLLSAMAYVGARQPDEAAAAYAAAAAEFGTAAGPLPALTPPGEVSFEGLDAALAALAQSTFAVRRRVVAACTACVAADRTTTLAEAELLRTVALTLDAPVPPIARITPAPSPA